MFAATTRYKPSRGTFRGITRDEYMKARHTELLAMSDDNIRRAIDRNFSYADASLKRIRIALDKISEKDKTCPHTERDSITKKIHVVKKSDVYTGCASLTCATDQLQNIVDKYRTWIQTKKWTGGIYKTGDATIDLTKDGIADIIVNLEYDVNIKISSLAEDVADLSLTPWARIWNFLSSPLVIIAIIVIIVIIIAVVVAWPHHMPKQASDSMRV